MNTSEYPGLPDHVKKSQVYEFDIYSGAGMQADVHSGLKALHENAQDIFYTPCNEGHWVITRYDLMAEILKDHEHFSNRELVIPKSNSPFLMIPLNLDPPDHAQYRALLLREVSQKRVREMEPFIRSWAVKLIDQVVEKGECDFTERLGAAFPVSVFLNLMGMPLSRLEEFRDLILEYFSPKPDMERRHQMEEQIFAINRELIAEKRVNPDDALISKLLSAEVRGRPLSDEEIESMCFLLFLGGLDTVSNALTFSFRNLAMRPDLQKRLRENPDRIADFVEESLRCFAVVNQTRIVKQDVEINGASFKEGDMVLCILAMGGLDDRKNPEPMNFDIDREHRQHITFSTGAHTCIGNFLARKEMAVFTQEWLKRVPSFQIKPDHKLEYRPGLIMALPSLPLVWEQA
jgi:cytochrome P450